MGADVPWNCGGGYVDIWISWRDETLESECPGFMKDEYVAVEQNSNKMNRSVIEDTYNKSQPFSTTSTIIIIKYIIERCKKDKRLVGKVKQL